MKAQLLANDDVVAECRRQVDEAKQEASKRDGTIESLKQEVKDEVNKQKLLEKKGHSTVSILLQTNATPVHLSSVPNSCSSFSAKRFEATVDEREETKRETSGNTQ